MPATDIPSSSEPEGRTVESWRADRRQTLERWAVVIVLAVHTGLLAWGAYRHSPTVDEPTYLVAGVRHLQTGYFELARVSPPLIRAVAAIPVVLADPETDWSDVEDHAGSRSEWRVAHDFIQANGPRMFWLMTLARWACLPFSLIGAWVCYRWANELYGSPAGLMALVLWCFSPNILGHGQLMSPDVGGIALGMLALYLFWRWLGSPGWWPAIVAGAALGLAQLSRTTWLVLYPLSLMLVFVWWWRVWPRMSGLRNLSIAGQFAVCVAISVYLINVGFGFEGTGRSLGRYDFVSRSLAGPQAGVGSPGNRFRGTWIEDVPVPLPRNYVLGIDTQKSDFERLWWSYLGGEQRQGGWWYYYLYGLLVKVPLGTWVLIGLAVVLTGWRRNYSAGWANELALLLPAAAVLVLTSSQTNFGHHVRYAFPVLPPLFVWSSKAARGVKLGHPAVAGFAALALVGTVVSSLSVYPHSLSYFNELAGGPKHGDEHLINSNIDWGQDLLYFKAWQDEHPEAEPMRFAYYGPVPPQFAGVEFTLPPRRDELQSAGDGKVVLEPGWYAVSVTLLRGRPFYIHNGDARRVSAKANDFSYFLQLEPTARVGYSIRVYRVERPTRLRI